MEVKSNMFVRGQVWYWRDPIFGDKEDGKQVNIGEKTQRYSRYVIVAQSTDTIESGSVLVIPCSTVSSSPYDIPVPMKYLYNEKYGYAKIRYLFPVHPRFLQNYICTLPEDIMSQIDAELITLLLPKIPMSMPSSMIKNKFGIDMNWRKNLPEFPRNSYPLENNVRQFIKGHLVSSDDNNSVSIYELKDAYDRYCIINDIDVTDDIVEFFDMFVRITGNSRKMDRFRFDMVEFTGIKIIGDFKVAVKIDDAVINDTDPQRPSSKWSDESIIEFLKVYKDEGIEGAMDKFGLKRTSAQSYWYKWRDRLDTISTDDINDAIDNVKFDETVCTKDILESISKFSNIVRDEMIDQQSYKMAVLFEKDSRTHIEEPEFYKRLGSSVYYSLLDLLSIHKAGDDEIRFPDVNENNKYYDTWKFFDRIYHDKRISYCRSGANLMKRYKEIYKNDECVDSDWIDLLKHRMSSRLNTHERGVNKICYAIADEFCSIRVY